VDERLKHLEPAILEKIQNEILDRCRYRHSHPPREIKNLPLASPAG
jgi:hypothetical protein